MWKNWAGNEIAHPTSIETPRTEEEVVSIVRQAADRGEKVKIPGSGHSFTPAAVTDGRMVRISALQGIYSIDRSKMEVRVGAGTTLNNLNRLLAAEGLAMANLGDIAYQTVAGAISTSTHGTGVASRTTEQPMLLIRFQRSGDGSKRRLWRTTHLVLYAKWGSGGLP